MWRSRSSLLDAAGAPYATTLDEAASRSLAHVRIAGRFQQMGRFIFDVAHNPEGSLVLAETLARVRPRAAGRRAALRARRQGLASDDANARAASSRTSFSPLRRPRRRVAPGISMRCSASRCANQSRRRSRSRTSTPRSTRASHDWRTTLVTGSFHTVGDAMARLQLSPQVPVVCTDGSRRPARLSRFLSRRVRRARLHRAHLARSRASLRVRRIRRSAARSRSSSTRRRAATRSSDSCTTSPTRASERWRCARR